MIYLTIYKPHIANSSFFFAFAIFSTAPVFFCFSFEFDFNVFISRNNPSVESLKHMKIKDFRQRDARIGQQSISKGFNKYTPSIRDQKAKLQKKKKKKKIPNA